MGLIRKLMIEARNRLDNKEERWEAINKSFFEYLPDTVKQVFIFGSYNSEVSTDALITELLRRNITVACPKVVARDIHFFTISALSDMKPGYHQIPEPDVQEEGRDIEEIFAEKEVFPADDASCLMVVPGVVFDEEGGRMGYGAGMYDRYLSVHPCRKLGLAYEIQVRDKLSLKDTDVRIDALITEKKIRQWDHAE